MQTDITDVQGLGRYLVGLQQSTIENIGHIRLSDISRCGEQTTSHIGYLPKLVPLWFRGVYREFGLFLTVFITNFTNGTNGTNLFRFSIREIRLFVSFVISKHLISHRQDSSMRCPATRIVKEPDMSNILKTVLKLFVEINRYSYIQLLPRAR